MSNNDQLKALIQQAGGPSKVGSKLKITRQAVCRWRRVPAEHVNALSDMTGIPPEKIRPDVFREGAQ